MLFSPVVSLLNYVTLMMKSQPSFEMTVTIHQTIQRQNHEDLNLQKFRFENIAPRL